MSASKGSRPPESRNIYLGAGMVDEMRAEAARLDRPISWVVQRAWKLARKRVAAMPSVDKLAPAATINAVAPEGA